MNCMCSLSLKFVGMVNFQIRWNYRHLVDDLIDISPWNEWRVRILAVNITKMLCVSGKIISFQAIPGYTYWHVKYDMCVTAMVHSSKMTTWKPTCLGSNTVRWARRVTFDFSCLNHFQPFTLGAMTAATDVHRENLQHTVCLTFRWSLKRRMRTYKEGSRGA